MKTVKPYGSWLSPLKASSITQGFKDLSELQCLHDGAVYWLESRPSEGGRNVVMRCIGDRTEEAIPKEMNARTRVHEYGGGAWLALDASTVVYSNFADQRLYKNDKPLTAESSSRYADACHFGEALYCVREEHLEGREPANSIARVSLVSGQVDTIASGYDFYASPRVSPDGSKLAFIRWSHPNMPWDSTELVVVEVETGRELTVVGSDVDESEMQPRWNPVTGDLFYMSDRSGWYSLYKLGSDSPVLAVESVDLGGESPGWKLGRVGYDFDSNGAPVASFPDASTRRSRIARGDSLLDDNPELPPGISGVCVDTSDDSLLFLGSSPSAPAFIGRFSPSRKTVDVLARAADHPPLPPESISMPERISFDTTDGGKAHALVYEPRNADFTGPPDAKPPLLVKAHGGPTACARAGYSPQIQFWTSRGFCVADVDYRGSTNYGRDFRRALRYKWGVYDVDDVCAAAMYLAKRGTVDADKLAIDGGSAGGFTTLGALAWRSVFKAGCSLYGVADLAILARDTHKFESRYLDRLIGSWPQDEQLYKERAPIEAVSSLDCPVLLLQGDEDKVVPPNQAHLMYDRLKAKGIPTALKIYIGEQHGFRKAENIIDALNSELYFFSRVFDFDIQEDDGIVPFKIDNLDR